VLARDLDGLVEIGALDDVDPRDVLLALDEGAVCHEHLSAALAHRRRVLGGAQPVTELAHTAAVHLLDPVVRSLRFLGPV
jgi:hypothetical protein